MWLETGTTKKEAAIHHCIDPSHLQDPIADGKPTTMYIVFFCRSCSAL